MEETNFGEEKRDVNPEPEVQVTESNGITQLVIKDEIEEERQNRTTIKARGGLDFMDRLLMSFSVFQNTEKIFSTGASSSTLGALNGIRVLSMWWVILGHSNSFLIGYRPDNAAYVLEIISTTSFMPVVYGTFAVDTFFVLSGLLVTYLTLKELAKTNGKVNWVLFYFHRFWRITPTYMVVLAVWATLTIHFGKGAEKISFFLENQEKCKELWWTYLLYINNLYPFPGNIETEICTGWTWYLANDMQFFIISPFILYLLYKYSKWGIGLIASLCLVSFGSTAYICWYWGLGAGATGLYNNRTEIDPDVNPNDDFIYTKPYCRIQAYLVGMALGFIIFRLNGRQVKINVFLNLLGWGLAIAVGASTMYGLQATYSGPQSPQWLAITYNALSRFAFSLSVAWVMFVCITGNGGYINRFLSWNAWGPLAKLSFAAYLVHPIVIYSVMFNMKSSFHWTYIEISYFFISNTVASYACAYVLSLLVEGPTVGLEKTLLGGMKLARVKKTN